MRIPLEKPGTPQELVHVGIKGMHWGVRKERETSDRNPSGPHDRIFVDARAKRRERRARGHEKVAAEHQKAIDAINNAKPSKNWLVRHHRNSLIKEHEKERDLRLKDAKDIRAGKFTTFQKKAIVGTAVVGTILATYGTYKLVDSGTARQLVSRGPLKTNDLLSRKMAPERIMKEVVAPINPNYGELGTKMNCRRATFAYEMRRRGMDVKATKSVAGTGQSPVSLLNAIHPKYDYQTGKYATLINLSKETKKGGGPISEIMKVGAGMGREPIGNWGNKISNGIDKSDNIFKALAEHPEGARGELGMRWRGGGAHSMAWEIINGVPHIFDTQSGKEYVARSVDVGKSEEFRQIAIRMSDASMTRLDNLPLNADYLKRWVTNVK